VGSNIDSKTVKAIKWLLGDRPTLYNMGRGKSLFSKEYKSEKGKSLPMREAEGGMTGARVTVSHLPTKTFESAEPLPNFSGLQNP